MKNNTTKKRKTPLRNYISYVENAVEMHLLLHNKETHEQCLRATKDLREALEPVLAAFAGRPRIDRIFTITHRTSGDETRHDTIESAAKAIGRAPTSLRVMLSKGKGAAHFRIGDDIVTVRQLGWKPGKSGRPRREELA